MATPQIEIFSSKSLAITIHDTKWIPGSCRFVVLGNHARGSGSLQVYELKRNEIKLLSETEKPSSFRCGTFGASTMEERRLATADFDGRVSLWDLERLEMPTWTVKAHEQIANCIDGIGGIKGGGPSEIVTGSRDGHVRVWDPRQKDCVIDLEIPSGSKRQDCWAVSFGNSTGGNRTIAAGFDNGDLKLFDMRNLCTSYATNLGKGICSIEFDRPDIDMNKMTVSTMNASFRVYDLRTQHPKEGYAHVQQNAHESTVWTARHSPQNRDLFVTTGGNGAINLWKYEYPPQRKKKDSDGVDMGVAGSVRLLGQREISTQPVHTFEWHGEREGLALVGSLDQTEEHMSLYSNIADLTTLDEWVEALLPPILSGMNLGQLLIDFLLLVFVLYILFRRPQANTEKPLTEKEIEEVIDNWTPLPLVPSRTPLMELDDHAPVVQSTTTTHVVIDGKEVLHLARHNFLGMINDKRVEEQAISTLRKYGTGTCGPRGFNGTIDSHLNLEKRIKDFLGTVDCCIYSYGFATVSSAIPAFSGRGDILVVDKGVSYALQTGAKLSRAEVYWFEHNDIADLTRILESIKAEDIATGRKITRRYIVIEGLYLNYGDIAPLDKIMKLKDKYCYRMIMDDTYGIGVLGKTGRGTTEHFNVPIQDIDILTGNLEAATSSVGGFCCGDTSIVYFQRLNSSGYVYSCSLPPLLATASQTALDILDDEPKMLETLKNNVSIFTKAITTSVLKVTSSPLSPVIHLRLSEPSGDRYEDEKFLQQIVQTALDHGIFLTRAKYVHGNEKFVPPASIRVSVSTVHTKKQLLQSAEIINQAAKAAASA
ncbi:serine C-palmitoyltransferase subunit [Planoprotostelium fungivorum]|uniref:serine C-palmitoyltransferase n=1 Tax=Planoprotostelium fungivorum TaxID=1890364 RepID=A0A2P6N360_9EUKA|nr:serine C-palmitoyltransferase subunit [Planoprotostelium fungivorum]